MKIILPFLMLVFSASAFASHPRDRVCVVSGSSKSLEAVNIFLQLESEREYVSGDPNKDIYDFKYQARVCDDDNDIPACSTFQSQAVTHGIDQEFTLVGMVDKNKVLFTGKTSAGNKVAGKILVSAAAKQYEDFKGTMSCIAQSWVELKAEGDSTRF